MGSVTESLRAPHRMWPAHSSMLTPQHSMLAAGYVTRRRQQHKLSPPHRASRRPHSTQRCLHSMFAAAHQTHQSGPLMPWCAHSVLRQRDRMFTRQHAPFTWQPSMLSGEQSVLPETIKQLPSARRSIGLQHRPFSHHYLTALPALHVSQLAERI